MPLGHHHPQTVACAGGILAVLVVWMTILMVLHGQLPSSLSVPPGRDPWPSRLPLVPGSSSSSRHVNTDDNRRTGDGSLSWKWSSSSSSSISERDTPRPSLRQEFEQGHSPYDWNRIEQTVQGLRVIMGNHNNHRTTKTKEDEEDVRYTALRHCPIVPPSPQTYPHTWPLLDLLDDWNPNEVNIPQQQRRNDDAQYYLYHSLCILDWKVHSLEQIRAYQQAEIPFVLQNHPEVWRAAERWNSQVPPSSSSFSAQSQDQTNRHHDTTSGTAASPQSVPYMVELLRNVKPQRNEYARHSNHLPFWRGGNTANGPTENVLLGMSEWWSKAQALEQALRRNETTVTSSDHYYFRLSAVPQAHNTFLYDELPILDPALPHPDEYYFYKDKHKKQHERKNNIPSDSSSSTSTSSSLFMVDPSQERGINCRFGMVGSMADSHFDPTRNWIFVFKGLRRYILSPPEECEHLNLHPLGHVSARHSQGNWGNLTSDERHAMQHAQALQVVLQPGDALYLPTSWFHFIVSLTTSFQCNARSGTTHVQGSELDRIFTACGFPVAMPLPGSLPKFLRPVESTHA